MYPFGYGIRILAILYGINIIAVAAFGETEFWFSMIKIIAILAMIATGVIMMVLHTKTSSGSSISNLWQHGLLPVAATIIGISNGIFAFLGIEFVGMTAAEAKIL